MQPRNQSIFFLKKKVKKKLVPLLAEKSYLARPSGTHYPNCLVWYFYRKRIGIVAKADNPPNVTDDHQNEEFGAVL